MGRRAMRPSIAGGKERRLYAPVKRKAELHPRTPPHAVYTLFGTVCALVTPVRSLLSQDFPTPFETHLFSAKIAFAARTAWKRQQL